MTSLRRYVEKGFAALQRVRLAPRLPPIPGRDERLAETAKSVGEKVREEYYPQMVGRAQAVRSRAQGGYTIAAAIAGAIVTAGALADVGERHLATKLVGDAALVLWLLTVVLYAQAVAGHVIRPQGEADGQAGLGGLAEDALHDALYEHAILERRLDWALYTTILAVVATILAILSAWALPPKPSLERGELTLTRAGSQIVEDLCGAGTTALRGRFERDDLDESFVSIELDASSCPASSDRTLEIRSRDVAAARS